MRKKMVLLKKSVTGVLTAAMVLGSGPVTALADVSEASPKQPVKSEADAQTVSNRNARVATGGNAIATDSNATATDSNADRYVLMNIPYAQFYEAEVENEVPVDAVSSATKAKPRTGTLVGGSYHEDSTGEEITGVTYPVKVSGDIDLDGFTEITDEDSVTITVTNRGQVQETTYEGRKALFESESYSYYVLKEKPEFYKELTEEDGQWKFGAAVGEVKEASGAKAELLDDSSYGDYQLSITGLDEINTNSDTVYGVVLVTEEGASYGLRHLENIWRGTNLAWCAGDTTEVHGCKTSSEHYESMVGQTIETIRYYTSKGIYEIPANITIPETKYVLMNIPYDEFYKAEINNPEEVDAVSSATKAKTRTGSLVGGSYHVSETGEDITGITYPVKVTEGVDLSQFKEVTDSDSYDITVTNRGKEQTTTYAGPDALFENPSYSYYVLSGKPSSYKVLTQETDGSLSFGKIGGRATAVKEASAELLTDSSYGDYQINVKDFDLGDATVYGVVLGTEEGTSYGLRHLENIWRGTSLAWCTGDTKEVHGSKTSSAHYESIVGKTINTITYYTSSGLYSISTDLYVPKTTYALMNIPYADFYENELTNDVPVDAVSSATKAKTRAGNLVAGSYHEDSSGSSISGITYAVKLTEDVDLSGYKEVTDGDSVTITISLRGKEQTTTYEGKDALFESPSYSYYILSEKPSSYKVVTSEDGKLSFGKLGGRATELKDASAELSESSKYGDYQLTVNGLELGEDEQVYSVILGTKEGHSYGLRHLENIWRGTNLAWCTGQTTQVHGSPTSSEHYKAIVGETINSITYITSTGMYKIPVEILVPEKTGADDDEPGTDENQPGTDENQPGTDENQPGTDENQPGTDENQPGTDENQPGTDENQPGTDDNRPGNSSSDSSDSSSDSGSGSSAASSDSSENGEWVSMKAEDGRMIWKYKTDASGNKYYVKRWAYIANSYAALGQPSHGWFHFEEDGTMSTGWFQDADGCWYYLNPSSDGMQGMMLTGWQLIDGKWYYFRVDTGAPYGSLLVNGQTPDGYLVDGNGAWIQ